MKKLLSILVGSVLAVSGVQAGTLAAARTKVDTWLASLWPSVTSKQDAYFTNNGRYWQGLLTCTGTNYPAFTTAGDGDAVQDNLGSKPTYEAESIGDIFPALVGVSVPAAFTCDQYAGPQGLGYVVTVFVRYNGTVYTRSQNVGPETWRTQAWAVYAPIER